MTASIRSAPNLQIAAPVLAILLSKNKKRLKKRSFLRRVKQTRGTTQIAKIPFRHLFEVQQLLCTDAAYAGNAYWVVNLWGFRLRRDGNFHDSLSGFHHSRLSGKFAADSVFIDAFENCLLNLSILYHRKAAVSIQGTHKKSPGTTCHFLHRAQMFPARGRSNSFLF